MLRDSEFCSSAHRENYKKRLHKALDQLAIPDPCPAGKADFILPLTAINAMPEHDGPQLSYDHSNFGISVSSPWPLTIVPSLGTSFAPVTPVAFEEQSEPGRSRKRANPTFETWTAILHLPGLSENYVAAEMPVATTRAAWEPRMEAGSFSPRPAEVAMLAVQEPIRLPMPQLEAIDGLPAVTDILLNDHPALADVIGLHYQIASGAAAPVATLDPVPAQASAAYDPLESISDQWKPFAPLMPPAGALPGDPPMAVESAWKAAEVFPLSLATRPLVLPRFDVRPADLEPAEATPAASVRIEERPVLSASAGHLETASADMHLPAFAASSGPAWALPASTNWMPLPAEPVVMIVRPVAACVLAASQHQAHTPALFPALTALKPAAFQQTAQWMPAPAAEMVMASLEPTMAAPAGLRREHSELSLPALPEFASSPRASAGPRLAPAAQSLEAWPAEALPIVGFAPVPLTAVPPLRMPKFDAQPVLHRESEDAWPREEFRGSNPAAARPEPKLPDKEAAVTPLPAFLVSVPRTPAAQKGKMELPDAALIPLEFYCQRGSGVARPHADWTPFAEHSPRGRFDMTLAMERLEEVQPSKPVEKKKDGFADVITMPEAAQLRARRAVMGHAVRAIAACLIVASSLWLGVSALRVGTSLLESRPATEEASASSGSGSLVASAGHSGAAAESHGGMAWFRSAVAHRATVDVTDNFHSGMQAWEGPAKRLAADWKRQPGGYVHPTELALFRPSLTFSDYRLEFLGQIENKSMDWVVRAHDPKNYYAMKFKVIEPGLRPVIAMVHYPVLGGKAGQRVEVPLSVMVHKNTPYRIAVDVKGNRFTTSIEGQEVDTWEDNTLASGGVGFFSEPGELARLYWMRVTKNDDFLGRICAYISGGSGDGRQNSAQITRPGLPGPAPAPATPAPVEAVALTAGEQDETELSSPATARVWIEGRLQTWSS
ncbi:MAG TPA: hypothetical protein VG675_13295 [Bryobacteraceae bacterium]|nr:hypothetical protein [Bryobacteraceae bacterium]